MHLAALAAVVTLFAGSAAVAQSTQPADVVIPPDAEAAQAAVMNSPRHGEWVDVDFADTPIKTYVVYPERADDAPVVIVIHEIFGMSDWIQGVADQLAAEGYVAIAPDLLSGMGPDGGATDSIPQNEVRQTIRNLTREMTNERLDAVREYAVKLPATTEKVGVVGFCWGGSSSFGYVVHAGDSIDAAIVYYGTGPDDAAAFEGAAAPVLGLYAGDDNRVNSTIDASKQAMEAAGKDYEVNLYDGAGHGFLRQQQGRDGANMSAAKQAWRRTLEFFKQHLEAAEE